MRRQKLYILAIFLEFLELSKKIYFKQLAAVSCASGSLPFCLPAYSIYLFLLAAARRCLRLLLAA